MAFRSYVYKVLEQLLCDVRVNRSFDSLQEQIAKITRKRENELELETSAQMWRARAEQLRDTLECTKSANEKDTERMMKLAQESDAQVDHAIFLNSGKLGNTKEYNNIYKLYVKALAGVSRSFLAITDYAERWAKARLEQQDIKLQLQRTDTLNELSEYSKQYNAEQIISAEMSAYLEADIEGKEEQAAAWTARYNEELVQRQQEIDELKVHLN